MPSNTHEGTVHKEKLMNWAAVIILLSLWFSGLAVVAKVVFF